MRIISKVQQVFDVQLPVGAVLETGTTVAELAEKVEVARWSAGRSVDSDKRVAVKAVEGMI